MLRQARASRYNNIDEKVDELIERVERGESVYIYSKGEYVKIRRAYKVETKWRYNVVVELENGIVLKLAPAKFLEYARVE